MIKFKKEKVQIEIFGKDIVAIFLNQLEYFISGSALIISIITAIFTAHKNRDLTHVIFNKPIFITSHQGESPKYPEVQGAAPNGITQVKTAIEIINASNHNRGYFDYRVTIVSDGLNIHLENKQNNTSGNLDERSHNTLIFEGESNLYVNPRSDMQAIISVKLVKRRLIPFLMYSNKTKITKNILWGTPVDFILENTDLLDEKSPARKILNKMKRRR